MTGRIEKTIISKFLFCLGPHLDLNSKLKYLRINILPSLPAGRARSF